MFEGEEKGKLDIQALEQARREGKRIGLVQGSWDQFHFGHQRYIKKAKEECDYLIVGVDSDEKIRARKGPNRPLIPEDERYDMIKELGIGKVGVYEPGKSIADDIVIKQVNDPKWDLIRKVKPDTLVVIPENYTMDELKVLLDEGLVKSVTVLGRQAETSTSNKLRQKLIANMSDKIPNFRALLRKSIDETRSRLGASLQYGEPYGELLSHLEESTDWLVPTAAAAKIKNKWYFGTNQCDYTLPERVLNERKELFYSTVEHAEINLLKRVLGKGEIDTVYVTLFPCDKCMKTLIDSGVKKIYYLEDHADKNWSKRSHALAQKKNIEIINVLEGIRIDNQDVQLESISVEQKDSSQPVGENVDYYGYKYIYPPNARYQEQLDIMVTREENDQDPLDEDIIDQPIVYIGDHWYISENRFPHTGNGKQILIIARDPVYSEKDLTDEMWIDLKKTWLIANEKYSISGGGFCLRFGDPALSGASLKRLHIHIIQPSINLGQVEKQRFSIGGRTELKEGLVLTKTAPKIVG